MSFIAFGTPGQNVRSLMQAMSDEETARQINPGEVAIATPVLGEFAVSADGKSLVPAIIPLTTLQAWRWGEAKVYRADKQQGGITTPKGVVQSDPDSRAFIDQTANSATRFKLNVGTSDGWSIDFRMADNSIVTHTADDMIAMADAITAFDKACQTASDAIRSSINAAPDAATLAALDITTGYPS